VSVAVLVCSASIGCSLAGQRLDRKTEATQPTDRANDREPVYLVLRLGERRLYLMDGDSRTPVESFPIAIGREGHDTPTGRFRVEAKIVHPDYEKIDPNDRTRVLKRIPPGPENPLGERWMTIAHGDGWEVGIHGTPQPHLLGQAVSGGCIRMRNADVIRVYDLVQLGTTVIVEP
jgi:lipoprotein-anchoring transpeptidase ErfK/SrfK